MTITHIISKRTILVINSTLLQASTKLADFPIDAKILQISLSQAELWPILSQISLSWQRGSVGTKSQNINVTVN